MMQSTHPPQSAAQRLLALTALLVMLASALLIPATAQAQEPEPLPLDGPPPAAINASDLPLPMAPPAETEADIAALVEPSYNVLTAEELAAVKPAAYMAIVTKEYAPVMADRMGFGTATKLSTFPNVNSLYAGWYVNWGVTVRPQRPGGMEFMQMIRVNQDLIDGCPRGTTADRNICPYKNPASYSYSPTKEVIIAAAKANPGSIWLIGNEMDRVDGVGVYQDEMKPEIYAYAYHELYNIVRAADPSARIANGGVVQFTPSRLEYMDKVWNTYKAVYGVNMPVDVWNVHNFVGSEFCRKEKINGRQERVCYGMGIPPGSSINPNSKGEEKGAYVGEEWRHVYMPTFEKQIRDFRAWMRNHGEMNKPLIVTEYGVLYKSLCPVEQYPKESDRLNCINFYGTKYVNLEDPKIVQDFMLATFNYFMNAKDPNLSGVDGGRLVQRWAWYSLEDAGWDFNPHTMLYTPGTTVRSETGNKYAQFAFDNADALQYP